jgi:hypothetical protein
MVSMANSLADIWGRATRFPRVGVKGKGDGVHVTRTFAQSDSEYSAWVVCRCFSDVCLCVISEQSKGRCEMAL